MTTTTTTTTMWTTAGKGLSQTLGGAPAGAERGLEVGVGGADL